MNGFIPKILYSRNIHANIFTSESKQNTIQAQFRVQFRVTGEVYQPKMVLW